MITRFVRGWVFLTATALVVPSLSAQDVNKPSEEAQKANLGTQSGERSSEKDAKKDAKRLQKTFESTLKTFTYDLAKRDEDNRKFQKELLETFKQELEKRDKASGEKQDKVIQKLDEILVKVQPPKPPANGSVFGTGVGPGNVIVPPSATAMLRVQNRTGVSQTLFVNRKARPISAAPETEIEVPAGRVEYNLGHESPRFITIESGQVWTLPINPAPIVRTWRWDPYLQGWVSP